jgi:pyridoxamine 5'-phosphate oxidase
MTKLSDIRKNYTKNELLTETIDKDPIKQFNHWFREAIESEVLEPNAMTLSTINAAGRPTSRIVLLKGIEENRFLFFTNYQSSKGKELEQSPACALNFFWPELERQVRIEGIAERIEEKASTAYFQSRPRGSQIGAWASPQSSVIKDRETLEKRVAELEEKYKDAEVLPKPNQWGGFAVETFQIEFWQGRSNRLHDRLVYILHDGAWQISRLAP